MTAFLAVLACLLLPLIVGAADLAKLARSQRYRSLELLTTALAAFAAMVLGTILWLGAPT